MANRNNINVASIDQSRMAELTSLLGDDIQELINEFFLVGSQELQQLENAVEDCHTDIIFSLCHSLKSSAGNLGFMKPQEECKQLELQARANEVIDAAGQYRMIRAEFENLRKLLFAA